MAELEKREVVGTPKEFAIYFAINIAIGFGLYHALHNMQQTIAGTIFIALVIGTLMFWRFRVAIAFIGVVLLLLTRTIDLEHTIAFMNLDVILFLVGMMVIVGLLRRSGFFRWLLAKALKISKFEPNRLMLIILAMSGIMAAMVDEVTSILFMTALVLDLCDYYEVSPVKYIISVVLATNIGSSWTVLGNPIGILIALRSGLTFENFIMTAFPIGVISFLALMVIVLIWQRGDLRLVKTKVKAKSKESEEGFLDEWARIKDRRLFTGSAVVFVLVIIGLALHHRMELALGLEHNTLLVAIAICGAGIVMLWQRPLARELLMRDVDWWTLVFFMFLFAKAGCLKYVGLTDIISASLYQLGGGSLLILIPTVLWISGFTSAACDNVLVVATFVPILQDLTLKLGTPVLWWALLLGSCYGGNMTMVGSTANIVALGILEDRKGYHMTLGFWIKIGLLGSVVPMAIGTAALLIFG
ncbi:MAG: SLC13 family permease [bacterium]|jgi:Na+/H+ antiporter NhaD/arsenite permease-like protein|nr:SLC13 family permease [candidate division KSB1 bacterium]MDH7561129.1 SLC13 family permease [bacterium]